MLRITDAIVIEDRELDERFVRASGPGGRNVNKVSTAVELRFDVGASSLPSDVKQRLMVLAGSRMTGEGVLLIDSREHRTQAMNREAARARLDEFEASPWGRRFPTVVAAWRRAWTHVIPFFAFPPDVRRVIYTTNALESVNARVRKIIKTRGHFPTDEAATKLLWLALRNITASWTKPQQHWNAAMRQFAILYDDRFNA